MLVLYNIAPTLSIHFWKFRKNSCRLFRFSIKNLLYINFLSVLPEPFKVVEIPRFLIENVENNIYIVKHYPVTACLAVYGLWLDVYKRQRYSCFLRTIGRRALTASKEIAVSAWYVQMLIKYSMQPVSYTHLDVYKRQCSSRLCRKTIKPEPSIRVPDLVLLLPKGLPKIWTARSIGASRRNPQ